MPVLHYGSKLFYVVHEPLKNTDTVKILEWNESTDFFSVSRAHKIIQWYISNEIMHILDANMTLTRLKLGLLDGRPTIVSSESISLSCFNNIVKTYEPQKKVGLTDTTLACNGKVLSIQTGEILCDVPGADMILVHNMLCIISKGKMIIKRNPGSRKLNLGDQMLCAHIKKFH